MCKYCNAEPGNLGEFLIEKIVDIKIGKFALDAFVSPDTKELHVGFADSIFATTKIKYCPKCGRKL